MKRIGILGGVSPESTVSYYLRITREYFRRYGDYSYPEILIYSVSFKRFYDLHEAGEWDGVAREMIDVFRRLASAGAGIGLIAANTLHRVFERVEAESPLPLIHIVDPTARAIEEMGLSRVGLLGTRYTMEGEFYRDRLAEHGIEAIVPAEDERAELHRIIYEELTRGIVKEGSRAYYRDVIGGLVSRGAEGIVLGCTEIPLLVKEDDSPVPVFDTAALHADAALSAALS